MSRHLIGASRIASVLGANPFQTAAELFEEMVSGRVRETNDHMWRGTYLEDGLVNWWAHLGRATDVRKQLTLAYPSDARLGATLDALAVVDTATVLVETKCPASGKAWHQDRNECPFQYRLQVVFQLGMAHANDIHCTHGVLAAGPIWGRLLQFRIEPNPQLFALMVQRAQQFLGFVERGEVLPASWSAQSVEAA